MMWIEYTSYMSICITDYMSFTHYSIQKYGNISIFLKPNVTVGIWCSGTNNTTSLKVSVHQYVPDYMQDICILYDRAAQKVWLNLGEAGTDPIPQISEETLLISFGKKYLKEPRQQCFWRKRTYFSIRCGNTKSHWERGRQRCRLTEQGLTICSRWRIVYRWPNSIRGLIQSKAQWASWHGGHLSRWLLAASRTDIWPQNPAWQSPSNSPRSVGQMHTWNRRTCAPLNSQDRAYFSHFVDVRRRVRLTQCELPLRRCSGPAHHHSSFRDGITVLSSTLLEHSLHYKWDVVVWKPESWGPVATNSIFLTSKPTRACWWQVALVWPLTQYTNHHKKRNYLDQKQRIWSLHTSWLSTFEEELVAWCSRGQSQKCPIWVS